jgi:STE24 endopeptidase
VNEDKAARYHRLKRRSGVLSLAWSVLLLGGLLLSGGSALLRNVATHVSQAIAPVVLAPALIVVCYVILLALVNEAGSLPIGFYGGFFLERRYGLSRQPLGEWFGDQLKAFALNVAFGAVAASIVYFFVRRSAAGWWLPTGVVFALLIVGLANLAPVLLMPLFYGMKPLERDSLRGRLLSLAERAGARVLGVYEWGLGKQTRKANAALVGLGRTRRILVSDTMLAEYSDDEIEVVLAHELAHHVHGDIWKGLAFESVLLLAGCFVAAVVLPWGVNRLGLHGVADVAGLPLLLLAAGAVSLVMLPAAHALSRAHERRADRFALDLTKNPSAFISAMKRLGVQNLAEEDPSPIVQWLFYSHPPLGDRIAAAQRFGR